MKNITVCLFLAIVGVLQLQAQSTFIQLDSLVAYNLEEDKGPFATMNDEVLVVQAIYDYSADTLLHWNCFGIELLSDSSNVFRFKANEPVPILDSLDYFLMLIEVDSYLSMDSISNEVQTEFLEYVYYPIPYLLNQVRLALGDDDLLYFNAFNQKRLSKMEPIIECKGMHIFNRFHYAFYTTIFTEE